MSEASRRGRSLTVTHVVTAAGVGRNTFYEHFVDLEAALFVARTSASREICQTLSAATSEARTPVERLRALAAAWLEHAVNQPRAIRGLLRDDAEVGELVRRELHARVREAVELARTAGTVYLPVEPLRLSCVVGAFEAAALDITREPSLDLDQAVELLVDVTLRVFR